MLNEEPFKLHSIIRQKFVGYLEHLTPEQLADIPYGFNNNIWWNIVHVIATQQLLSYYLSDNEMLMDMAWIENYKKGTAPNGDFPLPEEIAEIKNLLMSTQQQLQIDYFDGKLNSFKTYSSSFGYTMNSIEDVILFNLTHENMHLGTVMAMKKLV
ncbi:DinB family protein [Weeksellaceae bacterium KMM 9713]|uniref:DinB family protein n=1 Tax=Profundicola chukchiensis TaxID=2961959 RepID=A0A9X4RW68_9FLAO|nr:DinB family protein [Profundicola chukchiensis]MDG4945507.1 DinB family protein [Profundicola chukchiensis]MDG4949557.1 DinB family protein [Profundicola chukchiensis]